MAVTKDLLKKTLSVNVEDGITASGAVKIKSVSFTGINPNATDANVYAAGVALGSLMNNDVNSINLTEKNDLIEE